MKTFLMICAVCADFFSPDGHEFRVRKNMIGQFIQAPEWIKKTLLFKLLLKDGTIKIAAETKKERVQQENDPLAGLGADGKAEKPQDTQTSEAPETPDTVTKEEAPAAEEPAAEQPKKARTTRKKKDDAQ